MLAGKIFLDSYLKRIIYYKELGDKTFEELNETDFHFQPDEESNSIAIIIQHVAGNMKSRFTNFLTEDGEKEWRMRDAEFEEMHLNKVQLLQLWNTGWDCFLDAVKSLNENDLLKTITIRSEQLHVIDALNRQMAHYPYHVGQLVYIGKMIKKEQWKSLSIPKGKSDEFNSGMNHK
jgi:hypothetical protein